MYTYVQRPGCKKENTATHVYIRAGSRTPTRVRTARAHVHGWVGTEKQRRRRVHGEATESVVFMGRQRNVSCSSGGNGTRGSQSAWMEQAMETRPGIPQNGGNGLVFDRPRSKRDPVHREGSGVPQNGGNRPPMVETGVLLIGTGCGVPQNGRNGLVLERYGHNGGPVHREGCGIPQNGTPWDTVHLHC